MSNLRQSLKPEKKINVLIVITRLTIGGDTNVVLDIAEYLNKHPLYDVHLAVGPVLKHEVDLTYLAYERGIPTTLIHNLINHISPWVNLKALLELIAVMRRGNFDVVHTHSSVAGVVGRIAAFITRVPVIVHHVHGWGIQENMSTAVRTLYLILERTCALFTDRLIAVSAPTVQKGLAYGICKEEKFALIYNGINLEKFRQKVDRQKVFSDLGLDPECKIVGMIARLDQQKNPLDFIRAADIVVKKYPKVQFLIAGDGSLRSECESLINEFNLHGTFFLLGYRDDISRIMPILTLTVLSSLWEGLPVVFQEAMSAGKPTVANDVDGARDVIIDGETGYLVTPHQPEEMAERILYLLKNDDVCQQMGLTAQKYSERFSGEQMVKNISSLYRELSKT